MIIVSTLSVQRSSSVDGWMKNDGFDIVTIVCMRAPPSSENTGAMPLTFAQGCHHGRRLIHAHPGITLAHLYDGVYR